VNFNFFELMNRFVARATGERATRGGYVRQHRHRHYGKEHLSSGCSTRSIGPCGARRVHHDDARGKIGILSCSYNARWGSVSKDNRSSGGRCARYCACDGPVPALRRQWPGSLYEGGNIFLQAARFASIARALEHGRRLRIDGISTGSPFSRNWMAPSIRTLRSGRGQAVDRGDFCRYLNNCYVARLPYDRTVRRVMFAGRLRTAAVTWQVSWRARIGSARNSTNQNDIQVIYSNTIHRCRARTLSGAYARRTLPVRRRTNCRRRACAWPADRFRAIARNKGDYTV